MYHRINDLQPVPCPQKITQCHKSAVHGVPSSLPSCEPAKMFEIRGGGRFRNIQGYSNTLTQVQPEILRYVGIWGLDRNSLFFYSVLDGQDHYKSYGEVSKVQKKLL